MDEITGFAVHLAKESGKVQKEHYQKRFEIRYKGETNIVTDVDIACQERIVALIKERYPSDNIIAEEKENVLDMPGNAWIVDPIDGTTNYAHSYPFFCTSVAYQLEGDVVAGAVYNPIFDELFYASKGGGAYFNGQRVVVSEVSVMKKALLSTGFPYDLATNPENNIDHFIRFLYEAQAIRRDGSAALNLCYVACGRFDGHWEMKLNPWDIAAGALIVREAGGILTGLSGETFDIYQGDVAASNGLIHNDLIRILGDRK